MKTTRIETSKPVAYDSPDHIQPCGTAQNNTTNARFNRKLFQYIPAPEVRLLDIGCAGGGLVRSILDSGGFAVGIEGSDYSKRHKRAEWATIPDHLFTADVTEPFELYEESGDGGRSPLDFNVITGWEFFEHITEEGVRKVVANLLRHLAPRGIVLASICPHEHVLEGVTLHQTVQDKPWWVATFADLGLTKSDEVEHFFHYDWLRGEPDYTAYGYGSFPIALVRTGERPLFLEKLRTLRLRNAPYELLRTVYRQRRRFSSKS
jgi:SAM-dependent methyltransferase